LTDAQAKERLRAAGVGYAKGVSFAGAQESTIAGLIRLKQACGDCVIIVTSGTEGEHATGTYSHANGYKADLRLNSGLTSFIRTNYEGLGPRSDGAPQYRDAFGNIYAYEGDHWDVLYVPWE
jgi:hypothetical protein